MLVESALRNAIEWCGNKQKVLAELIGEDPDKISYWLNRAKRIPFHSAVAIEKATQGNVSRYDLAPYARVHRKPALEQESLENHGAHLTISQRVVMGLSVEKTLGNRRGIRSDLIIDKKQPELRRICAQVAQESEGLDVEVSEMKGKTTDLTAKNVGFSSRDTYLRAKKVVCSGIFKLVEAMDNKKISIATAAALAELPPTEQESLLSKSKKEILALLQKKSCKQTSPASTLTFLKDEKLKTAEQQHRTPLRLMLLVLLLQCDTSGYFPLDTDPCESDLLAHVPLKKESILTQLIELGWIKKVTLKQKILGQLTHQETLSWQKFVR